MDQTSRRDSRLYNHLGQKLNSEFIEDILLCSEDLQRDVATNSSKSNRIDGIATCFGLQRPSSGLVNIIVLYFDLF